MTLKFTYTGANTAAGFRDSMIRELERRIAHHQSESHRYTKVRDSAAHAARISELAIFKAFLGVIQMEPAEYTDAVLAELCEAEVRRAPGNDWSVTAATVAAKHGLSMRAVADAWARVRQ